jgi:tRNA(adenine34) deaminase
VDLFAEERLNHHAKVEAGLMRGECADILRNFFARRRSTSISKSLEDSDPLL